MTLANFVAYMAQIAALVLICAGLPRLAGLRSPGVQYVFWRVVLLACLALPFLQPWRPLADAYETIGVAGRMTTSAVPFVDTRTLGPASSPVYPLNFDPLVVGSVLIAVGFAIRLLWIAMGVLRLRSLRRAPGTEPADGFGDLLSTIGTTAPILWSPHVRHPVTFGLWRPVVLLPAALKAVDMGAQRAVVAHELHHVARGDWGWLIAEEIVRAAFWFHPAMWWLVSRVQLARETVVDELSILVTNARRTYLDALLAFADDSGMSSSTAFSARRHLFHRVMLLSKEGDMSSLRVAVGSGLVVVALGAGTWGATNAFPLYSEAVDQAQPPRDARPPRDPVPASAYHRQAVLLWEQARKPSLTPEEQLEFVSQGVTAENKALAINPEYLEALTYKNILLRMQANLTSDPAAQAQLLRQAEELRSRVIEIRRTMPSTAPPPPPPAPPAPTIIRVDPTTVAVAPDAFARGVAERNAVRVGGAIKPPAKIRDVKPAYPPEAQASRVQGVVILEIVIDADGSVADARILRSIPLLDAAAVEAVRQWQYQPTLMNGTPVSLVMTVTINFALQ